jgi:hypothetical protein
MLIYVSDLDLNIFKKYVNLLRVKCYSLKFSEWQEKKLGWDSSKQRNSSKYSE